MDPVAKLTPDIRKVLLAAALKVSVLHMYIKGFNEQLKKSKVKSHSFLTLFIASMSFVVKSKTVSGKKHTIKDRTIKRVVFVARLVFCSRT